MLGKLIPRVHSPFLAWEYKIIGAQSNGTSLKSPSFHIYIVFTIVYLVTYFYISYVNLVSYKLYFSMLEEFPRVLATAIKGHTQA